VIGRVFETQERKKERVVAAATQQKAHLRQMVSQQPYKFFLLLARLRLPQLEILKKNKTKIIARMSKINKKQKN